MAKNALLSAQMKQLLSALAEHSAQHLLEMETDLVQTNILLAEAIEKLSAGFMDIHKSILEQQALMDSFMSGVSSGADAQQQIKTKQEEISLQINSVVTGLQFQDMTNQLIGRAMRHLTGLRGVMSDVGSGSDAISTGDDTTRLQGKLEEIRKLLELRSEQLENELRKAVYQTHMESGDIELF